ncbi:histidine kinase [Bacterioplanes sanyensis]|uniref:Histidine kinase n=1 Tax=Bacterioplanes sanyensis TaxID=1249553 RepID=A0A222FNH4_9GAMM|nr:Hpt domain-containing protein [Bacterioplanes sanyensis]ASP40585.1 histidine kinase [Bacterioplanes sanyensis]
MSQLAAHFDQEALSMLQEVMDDEFPELVDVYLRDSDQRLPLLHQAIAAESADDIRELAHSFKGASSNVSAHVLAELCFGLEKAGRDNELANVQEQLSDIEREYHQVKSLLQGMING